MAALLRREVLLMFGLYLGGNRYRLVFEPLYDFAGVTGDRSVAVDEALRRYVARLEHYSRAYPFNWFNFFDVWEGAERPGSVEEGVQAA